MDCDYCDGTEGLHRSWCIYMDDLNYHDNHGGDECDWCHGTGGEPYDDGVTPCRKCSGVDAW